ncbi:MAG: hypothetical protein HY235_30115, partial [Acidobacteria bacterium]|nr:hypothetical protein [Acidobacteriota bacterium]
LPSSLGGFSTSYKLKLDDMTGSLRGIEFGAKALIQKSAIDAASTNINALLDAQRKKEAAEQAQAEKDAASKTVGAELERRKKLLETQQAVIKACKELGLNCQILIDAEGNPVKNEP